MKTNARHLKTYGVQIEQCSGGNLQLSIAIFKEEKSKESNLKFQNSRK